MWQPNAAQWRVIWIVALLLILAWPPEQGRSLGMKIVNFMADPYDLLPTKPDPLPIGLDDNGDAVTAHDALEAEYYRQYSSSLWTQLRMKLKNAGDPFDALTERQMLAGIGILSLLALWRLNEKRVRM